MHRRALRQAARVIVLGDDMRERILSKGIDPARVVVVRDGTSFPASMPDRIDPVVQEIRSGFPFRRATRGQSRILRRVGHASGRPQKSCSNENTGLVFVGDGANRACSRSVRGRFAKCSLFAVSPIRASAARDDGGRRSHRHGEARTRRRRRSQQTVFDSRGGASGACGCHPQIATPHASFAKLDADWQPIRTILPQWPLRFGAAQRSRAPR